MMIIPNKKHLFNIPPDVTFLNCSNMSPVLNSAAEAGKKQIDIRGTPWTITIDDWFKPAEQLRQLFGNIINAPADNIALVPSASYGIAVAAKNISLQPHQL